MDDRRFEIELFGGLRVRKGDREADHVKREKSAALLAYLAFHHRRRHSREVLCEVLWPDCDPESARNRLSVTFSRLRAELSEQLPDVDSLFVSDRSTIGMNRECVHTDVEQFEAHLRNAEATQGDQARAHALEEAVRTYHGSLLPGLYDPWIVAEQERIREQVNRALSDLVAILERLGELDEAIAYASRVVAAEPLLEKAHETLIRLLIHARRPAEALKRYRALELLLREELGIAPSAGVTALVQRLRQTATSPRPPESRFQTSASPPVLPPPRSIASSPVPHPASVGQVDRRRTFVRGTALFVAIVALGGYGGLRSTRSRPIPSPVRNVSATGTLLWDWRYTPSDDDAREAGSEPSAITSDPQGNIYACGFTRTKAHDVDFVTLKLTPDGKLCWTKRWNYEKSNDCDRARKIAVDREGNVYVTGDSYGGDAEKGGSQWDVSTVKYSPDGQLLWTRRFNSPPHDNDVPLGMVLDRAGNIYVAAKSTRPDNTSGFALIKYRAGGRLQWADRYGPPNEFGALTSLTPNSVKADVNGAILLTGEATMRDVLGKETNYILTVRYDRHGNPIWQRRFAAESSSFNTGRAVALDRQNNVYVVAAILPDDRKDSGQDMLVMKYDAAGNEVWSTRCGWSAKDGIVQPRGVAVDAAGNVFAVANAGPKDYPRNCLLYALRPDGTIRWQTASPHLELPDLSGLQIDRDGGIALSATGDFGKAGEFKTALATWRCSADGRELWFRDVRGVPGDLVTQRAIHQDMFGNVITAAMMAPAKGARPEIRLLKYTP